MQEIQKEIGQEQQNKKETELSFEEALNNNYVKFDDKKRKRLTITNFHLVNKTYTQKNADGSPGEKVEKATFVADVLKEDGKDVKKILSKSSKRFIIAIRQYVENVPSDSQMALCITQFGQGMGTQFLVEID